MSSRHGALLAVANQAERRPKAAPLFLTKQKKPAGDVRRAFRLTLWMLHTNLVRNQEIRLGVVHVGDHGASAGFPVGRADLAVLADVLERLEHAQGFIDTATDGQVVDRRV